MKHYEEYLDMLRDSIKNLFYAGIISESEHIKLRDKFFELLNEYIEKKDKL